LAVVVEGVDELLLQLQLLRRPPLVDCNRN
jgi:hypothetical protein